MPTQSPSKISVLTIDDHPLYVQEFGHCLKRHPIFALLEKQEVLVVINLPYVVYAPAGS